MKQPGTFRFFAFIVLIAIVGLACGGGTSPTQAPAVNPPTAEPQQPDPPTEPPAQPSSPSGEDFFTEEFEGSIDNWSVFTVADSDETNESALSLETDGGYLIFDIPTKYLYTYVIYEGYVYDDVSVEARVDNRGTNNNNISLLCRYSDEGWYEFNIANNGLYDILFGFENADGTIGYQRLADGGSNKIKSGKDVNEYKIICKGRRLSLYINGTETRVLEENQHVLRDGKIGISASSFNDPTAKVEFDWVNISQP
jgi:hypothetical protein